MGLHILSLGDTWVTGAGCTCSRCQAAYARACGGRPIPERLDPADLETRQYLTWRADVVWQLGCELVGGPEFFDRRDGGFTLLTGEPFSEQRQALGRIHRWLETQADLYEGVCEASPVAVIFPYATLPFDWRYAAQLTFAACRTLIVEGVPFRIVGPGSWDGVEVLIVPPGLPDGFDERLRQFAASGGRVISLGEGRGVGASVWLRERPEASFLERHSKLRAAAGWGAMALFRVYFSSRVFRRLLDRLNVTQRVIQGGGEGNPLFSVPPAEERAALPATIGDLPVPQAEAQQPVLVTWWRWEGTCEHRSQARAREVLHLVNYADEPQDVTVRLPWLVRAQVLSPDHEGRSLLEGCSLRVRVDVYTVLVCDKSR